MANKAKEPIPQTKIRKLQKKTENYFEFGKLVLYFAAGIVPGSLGYTILYIAPYGHIENRKLKSNYKLKNSKTIMEKKEMYLAPEVEVLEVEVEKGFAASPITDGGGVEVGGGASGDDL